VLDVDMVAIAWTGLALWGLGLVVTGVLALTGHLDPVAPATCAAGLLIGALVLRWGYRHRPSAAQPPPA